MLVRTSALVIHTIKYSEDTLICHCYTLQHGLKSLILKGNKNSKIIKSKVSFLMPLSQIELIIHQTNPNSLGLIKEVKNTYHYQTLHIEPKKIPITLFLADLLKASLKEDVPNESLFNYLLDSLKELDDKIRDFADFHLWFTAELTKFLGFYPNTANRILNHFNLKQGIFTTMVTSEEYCLNEIETALFKRLLLIDFGSGHQNEFNRQQRTKLLQLLLRYYKFHLENFYPPKSVEILAQLV